MGVDESGDQEAAAAIQPAAAEARADQVSPDGFDPAVQDQNNPHPVGRPWHQPP